MLQEGLDSLYVKQLYQTKLAIYILWSNHLAVKKAWIVYIVNGLFLAK